MDLNKHDLYKRHDQLSNLKKTTYEQIYTRCVNKIKLTADAGELICIFIVPDFLFGSDYPLINVSSCATYIIGKLCKSNKYIKASYHEPNVIFIDWRRDIDF